MIPRTSPRFAQRQRAPCRSPAAGNCLFPLAHWAISSAQEPLSAFPSPHKLASNCRSDLVFPCCGGGNLTSTLVGRHAPVFPLCRYTATSVVISPISPGANQADFARFRNCSFLPPEVHAGESLAGKDSRDASSTMSSTSSSGEGVCRSLCAGGAS